VHMYHEIAQPFALLYNLVPALKPGALVGIVDAFRPTSEHGTPPSLLRCELAAVGYREISTDRLTGSQAYLAIFAPHQSRTAHDRKLLSRAGHHSPSIREPTLTLCASWSSYQQYRLQCRSRGAAALIDASKIRKPAWALSVTVPNSAKRVI